MKKLRISKIWIAVIVVAVISIAAWALSGGKEKEEINFKQTLFRKLQRFSDENGGTEIDWNDEDQNKFIIKYSHFSSKLIIDCYHSIQYFGQVYFASKEVARKAIELFHDDLIKYFTM